MRLEGGSLAVTYFRTGCRTIIGAVSFHGPVRDGKGWFQDAMAARQSGVARGHRLGCARARFGSSEAMSGMSKMVSPATRVVAFGGALPLLQRHAANPRL